MAYTILAVIFAVLAAGFLWFSVKKFQDRGLSEAGWYIAGGVSFAIFSLMFSNMGW